MSTERRAPSAEVSGASFSNASLDSVTVSLRLGFPATAQFRIHRNADAQSKALKFSVPEFAEVMGTVQTTFYTSRSEPDATITMQDGKGGDLTFTGFTSKAANSAYVGMVGQEFSAIEQSAVLGRLKSYIYDKDDAGPLGDGDGEEVPTDGDLATRIQTTFENMVSTWENNKTATAAGADDVQIKESIHASNDGPQTLFKELLSNSTDLTAIPGLDAFSEPEEPLNLTVYEHIKSVLRSSPEDFFQVLAMLGSSFQLLYCPAWDSVGQLKLLSVAFSEVETAEVDLATINMSCGADRVDMPTHVMVKGIGSPDPYSQDKQVQADDPSPQVQPVALAIWPETAAEGASIVSIGLPPWVPQRMDIISQDAESMSDAFGSQAAKDALNAEAFTKVTETHVAFTQEITEGKLKDLIKGWLKQVYVDMALSSSTAQFSVPLDLGTWEVGKVYEVTNVGDESGNGSGILFRGLLNSISHTLAVKGGGGGEAATSLQFTHVEAGSFVLPSK